MKVKDCMTLHAVSVGAQEPVAVAARLMARYNLGMLPVVAQNGGVAGVVTDRDLVLRCVAGNRNASELPVERVMSNRVISVSPEDNMAYAASLMARERVRRLPVAANGQLVGMISLGDLARQEDYAMEAGECLAAVCTSVRRAEH